LLLCPSRLSFDWSMNSIELVENVADRRNVESVIFYSTLSAVVYKLIGAVSRKRKRLEAKNFEVIVTSLSIVVLSFLPASNLV
jgi:hypothetical protein